MSARRASGQRRPLRRLFALCAMLAASAPARPAGPEDADLLALLDLLQEQTTIATQTRMNADYVPGMVTVLQGDDMRARGLATIGDALGQVAGFHVTVDNVGDVRAIVRGVGATLNATNLKILLDGVVANRPTDGSADWVLRLPLAQIERIEVIRGPGSAIYGGFAFSGVVNVVTRNGDAIGAGLGSDGARQGDLRLELGGAGNARLQLKAGAWTKSDSGLVTNPDNFAEAGLGYSPASVFDGEHGRYLLAALEAADYRLQLRHAVLTRGGGYGRTAALPPGLEPRVERILGASLDKHWQLGEALSLSASLGIQQTDLERATFLPIPAGVTRPGAPGPLLREDYRRDGSADRSHSAELALIWTASASQRIYLGASHERSKVTDAFTSLSGADGLVRVLPANQSLVLEGSGRAVTSLTVQDQLQLFDDVELTAGLRYDHYDDWGGHTSPRLAAVWRPGDHHIFKLQYAEAFRPPSLTEFYPGPEAFPGTVLSGNDLDEERIRSLEAAYVLRWADRRLRLTLYRTEVQDLIEFFIDPGRPPVWRNRGDIETRGAELEWTQRIGRSVKWWANLAYVDAEDHLDRDERLLGAVDWLAGLGVGWHPDSRVTHTLSLHYVGEQEGWELRTRTPQRERFDDYVTLDYAVTMADLLAIDGLSLAAGIRNLTDQHYASVATPAQFPEGLPHGERQFWLHAGYQF